VSQANLPAPGPWCILCQPGWAAASLRDTPTRQSVEFTVLAACAPDESIRRRIPVENPETLYGFEKSA
jgi:hypothetical protein